jgi:hypothetical protein
MRPPVRAAAAGAALSRWTAVVHGRSEQDARRAALLGEFGIDTRRASATVVIGYPDFQRNPEVAEVHETLRIFNSHLSRVEVITYHQLLDRAGRMLDLAGKPDGVAASAAGTPSGS